MRTLQPRRAPIPFPLHPRTRHSFQQALPHAKLLGVAHIPATGPAIRIVTASVIHSRAFNSASFETDSIFKKSLADELARKWFERGPQIWSEPDSSECLHLQPVLKNAGNFALTVVSGRFIKRGFCRKAGNVHFSCPRGCRLDDLFKVRPILRGSPAWRLLMYRCRYQLRHHIRMSTRAT